MSFKALFDFEDALAAYTGAPYAVVTDGCTHALELCFRHDQVEHTRFTAYTYLSVPMLMRHLDIEYEMVAKSLSGIIPAPRGGKRSPKG
jgi:dTDP-4-amino-4,6-dideoxygalactose transaminase